MHQTYCKIISAPTTATLAWCRISVDNLLTAPKSNCNRPRRSLPQLFTVIYLPTVSLQYASQRTSHRYPTRRTRCIDINNGSLGNPRNVTVTSHCQTLCSPVHDTGADLDHVTAHHARGTGTSKTRLPSLPSHTCIQTTSDTDEIPLCSTSQIIRDALYSTTNLQSSSHTPTKMNPA